MAEPKVVKGKLVADQVKDKVYSEIEKGPLTEVNALVVHQTGSDTAQSSFNSYKDGQNGAHFLIDRDGTIYQTARIDQTCWHVGKIRSRCYQLKSCSKEELKNVRSILFKKGDSYSARVKALNTHEADKDYPDRYPTNSDSLGIELVAQYSGTEYDDPTDAQNASLKWLVETLERVFDLSNADIFRHSEVGYKQPSEASGAKW